MSKIEEEKDKERGFKEWRDQGMEGKSWILESSEL